MDADALIGLIIATALANRLLLAPLTTAATTSLPALREFALHGVLVALVTTLAGAALWSLHAALRPLALLHPTGFLVLPCVAAATALSAVALVRWRASLAQARWWLIACTAAVLNVAPGSATNAGALAGSLWIAFALGAAFAACLLLLSGLESRLQPRDVPASFRGLPVLLLNAGLLALACLGLVGIVA